VPEPEEMVITQVLPLDPDDALMFEPLTDDEQEAADALGVKSPAKLKARVSAETRTALKRDLGVFRT
jgi:hypothetical protein